MFQGFVRNHYHIIITKKKGLVDKEVVGYSGLEDEGIEQYVMLPCAKHYCNCARTDSQISASPCGAWSVVVVLAPGSSTCTSVYGHQAAWLCLLVTQLYLSQQAVSLDDLEVAYCYPILHIIILPVIVHWAAALVKCVLLTAFLARQIKLTLC